MTPQQEQELKGLQCQGCRDGVSTFSDDRGVRHVAPPGGMESTSCTANPAVIATVDEMMAAARGEGYSLKLIAKDAGISLISMDMEEAIAAAEAATVEAASKIADHWAETGGHVGTVGDAIRALAHTSILANRIEQAEEAIFTAIGEPPATDWRGTPFSKWFDRYRHLLSHRKNGTSLANREAEIRRQERENEAKWWSDKLGVECNGCAMTDYYLKKRLAELTAPPTTESDA